MNGKVGVLTENSGQASRLSTVKSSDDSLHTRGCVSTYEKKEEISCHAAYLESQRQYFEEVGQPQDETQYLKAENQKRTEEMLQKAKEELCKRKEKCNGEDTNNIKEGMVPDTNQRHQSNSLEMLHKMVWLQNRNHNSHLESCHKAGDARNTAGKEIVPLKREETDEYFSCTKQAKSKGRRKNRPKTLISLEDLEKPLLEAATYQEHKHAQSHHKSTSASIQQTHVCLPLSPPEITCWQRKAGADLFPDVPTRTLTIYGAGASEDVLLKLAIEESLKTHEAENCLIDLSKTDRMDLMHPNTCNNVKVMPLPVLEPIKDESWDDAEKMVQDGRLSLQDNSLAVAGHVQDCTYSSTKHEDWEMGASQATRKVNEAAEKCGIRGRNQKRNDSLESVSSTKVSNVTTAGTGQYRSQHRVEIDAYNHNGHLNHTVKSGYEENVWGPLENDEASARVQNEKQCPIKKRNQIWKTAIPNPNLNFGDSMAARYMPEASDSRIQEQVGWKQSKSHVKNLKDDHDQNLMVPLPCSRRNRTVSQSYVPEASDDRTREQVEWKLKKGQTENQKSDLDQNLREPVQGHQRSKSKYKTESYIPKTSDSRTRGKVDRSQKKDLIEKQKGYHDQNLREIVQGHQRNRRENKAEDYIPEASDSRTQGKVDGNQKKDQTEKKKDDHDQNFRGFVLKTQEKAYWNPENNLVESQKVNTSHNNAYLGVRKEKSLKNIQHQKCFVFRNQNLRDKKPVYFSDEEWETKDNELDRKNSQGDSWVDSKVQRHGPVSQDTGIYRMEETSLGRDEGVGMPDKRMSDHFGSRKCEDSGEYVHTNNECKGVCSDELELSYGENSNSAVQDGPGPAQMCGSHICDTHQHQMPNQFVDSPTCTSQWHSVARPLYPMNSMAGVFPITGSSPAQMDTNMQIHAQQTASQAFQPSPTADIQKLFEAFVQEQQQHIMTMNYLIQMAVMNTTGLPNTKPASESQAQQPVTAELMNFPKHLPTHCNDLPVQSDHALLNPFVTQLLNPSLLSVNQAVAPRNVPSQSEASFFNREGNSLLMPNPYINVNSAGNRSLDNLPFLLSHRNHTNNPNTYMNSTVSTSLNDSPLHGVQTNDPLLMPSSFAIGRDHMMHLNYESTETQLPAIGNMQNMMQHVAPDVCSQPLGSRPASVGTSSRMVIGKGRGRLIT